MPHSLVPQIASISVGLTWDRVVPSSQYLEGNTLKKKKNILIMYWGVVSFQEKHSGFVQRYQGGPL